MMILLKVSLLLLLLCCAVQLTSAGPQAVESANGVCCFEETRSRIPLRRLKSYYWTNSSCPYTYIVFVTTKKIHRCVKPDNKWVQLYINHIDKKSASDSPK
ncbi:C-C motif chemokine 22-like [Pimephales promelas]|uniref:C-C motif chemokine 22-like n=1 Tax=Pimephales promelas TaxID=90988 RepID=UPI001955BD5E|nr:C-C motif chemokine 22-like [Pimephales promelas]